MTQLADSDALCILTAKERIFDPTQILANITVYLGNEPSDKDASVKDANLKNAVDLSYWPVESLKEFLKSKVAFIDDLDHVIIHVHSKLQMSMWKSAFSAIFPEKQVHFVSLCKIENVNQISIEDALKSTRYVIETFQIFIGLETGAAFTFSQSLAQKCIVLQTDTALQYSPLLFKRYDLFSKNLIIVVMNQLLINGHTKNIHHLVETLSLMIYNYLKQPQYSQPTQFHVLLKSLNLVITLNFQF